MNLPQENARQINRVMEMKRTGPMKMDRIREQTEIPDKYFVLWSIPTDRIAGW